MEVVIGVCCIWLFFVGNGWGFNFLFDEYEGKVVKYECICYINYCNLVCLIYFVVFYFVNISFGIIDCLDFWGVLFNRVYKICN